MNVQSNRMPPRSNSTPRAGLVMAAAALVAALAPPPASAYEVGPSPTGTMTVVADGEGTQTDPHVSGNLVSYTSIVNSSSEIRYHDLATGADKAVPQQADQQDSFSDVSGSVIVFGPTDSIAGDLWALLVALAVLPSATPLGAPPARAAPGAITPVSVNSAGREANWADQGARGS